jgi:hypothetical protein
MFSTRRWFAPIFWSYPLRTLPCLMEANPEYRSVGPERWLLIGKAGPTSIVTSLMAFLGCLNLDFDGICRLRKIGIHYWWADWWVAFFQVKSIYVLSFQVVGNLTSFSIASASIACAWDWVKLRLNAKPTHPESPCMSPDQVHLTQCEVSGPLNYGEETNTARLFLLVDLIVGISFSYHA